jgi:hypothetical protein
MPAECADEVYVNTLMDQSNSATIQIPAGENRELVRLPCCFQGVEGKRLSLVSNDRVPSFTPITVEYNYALFLGEVVACTEDVSHHWHLEVKIEQILTGLQSLMNLRANLLGEPMPAPLHMMPVRVIN